MPVLVVSAADQAYADLLLDMVRSVRAAGLPDFRIGCLDLGLDAATREILSGLADHIAKPDWPFKPHPVFDARPTYLARAIRPFLPNYFPGFDAYIWLDADCWVQMGEALKTLAQVASGAAMAVVPAVDRSYFHHFRSRRWVFERYCMALGREAAKQLLLYSYINTGVFALKNGAPHWRAWEQNFQKALDRWEGTFLSDQAVLNALIYIERLPAIMMPAEYNWLCHLALPMWAPERKLLVSPNFPWSPLGIIHNTFRTKQRAVQLRSTNGQTITTELTYTAYRALAKPPK
jgi:hypothetical protein